MRNPKLAVVAAALTGLLALSGCASPDSGGSGGGDEILIGAPLGVTGALGPTGAEIQQGAELAMAELAEKGKNYRLVVEDTAGDPAQAVTIGTSMGRDQEIIAMIGPISTPEVGAMTTVAESFEIPLIVPAAVGEIPGAEDGNFNDYTFRIAQPRATLNRPEFEKVMERVKPKHVAVISFSDNPIYIETSTTWIEVAEAGGAETVNLAYPSAQTDVSSIITQIPPDTDLIAMAVYPASHATLARSIRQAGIDAQLFGENGLPSQEVWDGSRGATLGALAPSIFVRGTSAAGDAFADAYEEKYDREPTPFAAVGYDSVMMIDSVLGDGGASREALTRGLSTLQGYQGVTGTLGFEGSGDVKRDSVPLVEIGEGGALIKVDDIPIEN